MDVLGAYDRIELYSALIVDAPNRQTASMLARTATIDPTITAVMVLTLYSLISLNFD